MNGLVPAQPLDGWVIAVTAGKTLIGKPSRSSIAALEPVYELIAQMTEPRPGQIGFVHIVLPLLLLSSIRSAPCPNALVIPIASLSPNERKILAAAVTRCDDLLRGMRASDAGIAVAPPGLKLR